MIFDIQANGYAWVPIPSLPSELTQRVAQRFVTAEVLTKQWIMGVRRGWLSLLKPSIHDWQDVFVAFDKLFSFVDNLEEQVLYVRRGPFSVSPSMSDGKEMRAVFKTLREALTEHRKGASFWYEQATGKGIGGREEDGKKMLQIYTDNFAGTLDTHVKTRRNPSKGRWNPTRSAGITEILDKLLVILREDAKRLEEVMQAEEEHDISITRDNFSEPTFKEFSFGRMKVVVTDPEGRATLMREYVGGIDRAYTLIKRKGFGKLWYGRLFIKSSESEKLSPSEQAAYAEYGYESLESRAGVYHSGEDEVTLTVFPEDAERVVVHELGNRYWFKFMSATNRARFNSLVQSNPSKKTRDFPSGPTDDLGILKPVVPVSTYGKSSIEEAFADVFERYVRGGDMDQDQLESFRSVLASEPLTENASLLKHVVDRYLNDCR